MPDTLEEKLTFFHDPEWTSATFLPFLDAIRLAEIGLYALTFRFGSFVK